MVLFVLECQQSSLALMQYEAIDFSYQFFFYFSALLNFSSSIFYYLSVFYIDMLYLISLLAFSLLFSLNLSNLDANMAYLLTYSSNISLIRMLFLFLFRLLIIGLNNLLGVVYLLAKLKLLLGSSYRLEGLLLRLVSFQLSYLLLWLNLLLLPRDSPNRDIFLNFLPLLKLGGTSLSIEEKMSVLSILRSFWSVEMVCALYFLSVEKSMPWKGLPILIGTFPSRSQMESMVYLFCSFSQLGSKSILLLGVREVVLRVDMNFLMARLSFMRDQSYYRVSQPLRMAVRIYLKVYLFGQGVYYYFLKKIDQSISPNFLMIIDSFLFLA